MTLIVAASQNDVIGRAGDLPWRLPDDLKQFKRRTMGHAVVMGRRTYESIGRPLPGRMNIVVSRRHDWSAPGVSVAHGIDQAIDLAAAAGHARVFIIGGQQVYAAAIGRADRLVLTRVHAELEGDARFEGFEADQWKLLASEKHPADTRHAYAFTVMDYQRATPRS